MLSESDQVLFGLGVRTESIRFGDLKPGDVIFLVTSQESIRKIIAIGNHSKDSLDIEIEYSERDQSASRREDVRKSVDCSYTLFTWASGFPAFTTIYFNGSVLTQSCNVELIGTIKEIRVCRAC